MMTLAIILGLLITPLLLSSLVNRLNRGVAGSSNLWGCIGITLVFCFTGVGPFILTEPMCEMLLPWVPWRIPLIWVTGVIELAVAFAVLVPRLRWIVGWAFEMHTTSAFTRPLVWAISWLVKNSIARHLRQMRG